MVYRALALEGFTAIKKDSKSIQIFPEGKEPKMSPDMVEEEAGQHSGQPGKGGPGFLAPTCARGTVEGKS